MLPSVDELKERYSEWSNDRLLSVLHKKEEYTIQAVDVARAELAKRNLTTDDVDLFLDEQAEREEAEKMLSKIPLTFWEKALFFFAWFAPWFLAGALRLNYSEDGLRLKIKQSYIFSIAGFVAFLLDGIICFYFRLGAVSGIGLLASFFLVFWMLERKITYDQST